MKVRLNITLTLCCLLVSLYLFFLANDEGQIATRSSIFYSSQSTSLSSNGQVQSQKAAFELIVQEAKLENGHNSNINMNMWLEAEDIKDLIEKVKSDSAPVFLDIEPIMHDPNYCYVTKNISDSGVFSFNAEGWRSFTSGWVPFEKQLDTLNRLDWIFYVHSFTMSLGKRQTIRRSWGKIGLFKKYNFKVIFVLGRASSPVFQDKIKAENSIYGDILQGDFMDTYRNLTYKAVFALRWLSTYCSHVPIALKADDDAFINIFELKNILVKYSNPMPINTRTKNVPTTESKAHYTSPSSSTENSKKSDLAIICSLYEKNTVPILRNKTECRKWCLNKWEMPKKSFYPRYCSGIIYILTMPLVQELYDQTKTTPFLWIDDVYVTGLLTPAVPHINYVSIKEHVNLNYTKTLEQYKNTSEPIHIFVSHVGDEKLYTILWNQLLKRLTENQLNELTVSAEDLKLKHIHL